MLVLFRCLCAARVLSVCRRNVNCVLSLCLRACCRFVVLLYVCCLVGVNVFFVCRFLVMLCWCVVVFCWCVGVLLCCCFVASLFCLRCVFACLFGRLAVRSSVCSLCCFVVVLC